MKHNVVLYGLSAVCLLAGFLFAFSYRPHSAQDLLRFDHSKHKAIACEVCHLGVTSRSNATIPTQQFCAKCHNTSPDTSHTGLSIWQASQKATPWKWPVSYRLPDHVYFSHQRHTVIAGISCQACHGDMSARTTPVVVPIRQLNMNDCLACHRKMNASADCARCHR